MHPVPLINVSTAADKKLKELESFLLNYMYQHETMNESALRIESWLTELFNKIKAYPTIMPGYYQSFIPGEGLQRTVIDYIAGMTDRYCLALLEKQCRVV